MATRKQWDGIDGMKKDVKSELCKIQSKKQPGTYDIKGDRFRWLQENSVYLETLSLCLNNVVNITEVPAGRKSSKTVTLLQTSKLNIKEHRPVVLTNTSYNLTMSKRKKKGSHYFTGRNRRVAGRVY